MTKIVAIILLAAGTAWAAEEFPKPYSPPCVERENVFEFTEKPKVKNLGNDKYEITFAVKANCDVTVGIVDPQGVVVRHLGAGVLGANAPAPFQKDSLKQTLYWNGKDDLGAYHKEPEKLKLRVMLGLKPVFDKRLGGTSPYNLPGYVMGMTIGPDAAYVLTKANSAGFQHVYIRKFDRDGKYLCSLVPPAATLPETKLGGMAFVEYEPGKRAVHGPSLTASINHNAFYLVPLDDQYVRESQPVLIGDRLFFANTGVAPGSPASLLHYIYTDGSTDVRGIKGVPLAKGVLHNGPRLAVSPDGKKIYLCAGYFGTSTLTHPVQPTCLYVTTADGAGPAAVWAGEPNKPGSDNQHFGGVVGIDCDAQGRIYASDAVNNRVQILSPEGKHLKTIPVDRPGLVCVHRKTGAIYVQHGARVEGRSVSRLTKFASFDDPKEEFHMDGLAGWMALDHWSDKPRLWLATQASENSYSSITIWEERGTKLEKVLDFEAEARKEPGWYTRWNGLGSLGNSKSVCDPVRGKLYYSNAHVFDLATGAYEGSVRFPRPADDIGFDKKGYLHGHENPGSGYPNVWRADPARAVKSKEGDGRQIISYPECPYDYGEEAVGMRGVVRTKCQPGACTFQMGMGVNMQGDIAVESQIYYVPKMEEEGMALAMAGPKAISAGGQWCEEGFDLARLIKEADRRGEQVYSIRREPGIPLAGSTIWTFDRFGETKNQFPAVIGNLVNGVQMDEEGFVYFATRHARRVGNKIFLEGKSGVFGEEKRSTAPLWVYGKGRPEKLKVLSKNAPIPLDEMPKRPFDLGDHDAWVEGVEWLYAGASPIVDGGCCCPQSRFHLDWYKRSYVPEAYRHSFAILDTNGNLIMHVGRYGNFDSAPGGKDGCKPGETDIGIINARYIGGTDNYLAFEDWGERMVVLKLNYHAEESVGIGEVMSGK